MDTSEFVFNVFLYPIPDPYSTTSDSIRIKQDIRNLLKSFLSITSKQLFNFIITNNAWNLFNTISINNFSINFKLLMIHKD